MSRNIRLVIILFLFVLTFAPQVFAGDELRDALSFQNLHREDIKISKSDLQFRGEKETASIPLLHASRENPFKMSRYCKISGENALENSSSFQKLTTTASLKTGRGQHRGWLENPLEDWKKNSVGFEVLSYELDLLYTKFDLKWSRKLQKNLAKDVVSVPQEAITATIVFLRAVESALRWRKQAFRNCGSKKDLALLYHSLIREYTYVTSRASENGRGEHPAKDIASKLDLLNSVDLEMLFTGGHEIALAVDHIATYLRNNTNCTSDFMLSIPTPLGEIVIGGGGENFYPDGKDYLLIIDLGGNDNYRTGASNLSAANPVSCVVDLTGDDIYYAEMVAPAFGSGIMGYCFHVDVQGDDYYKLTSLGLGSGVLGVGGFMDKGGKDTYIGVSYCCGAATCGIGVFSDLDGDDNYEIFHGSCGYAGPLGAGIHVDVNGNDKYVAKDDSVRFPSAQSKDHNSSMCFGAACGRRADFLEGHSLNGGFALFAEGAGDDEYSCGVFGIAVGYWGGVGMLYERKGDDKYTGQWYAIGATAHFAASAFVDAAGDDSYRVHMNMGIGAGHDYSVSVFEDCAGSDNYDAPNLSLGAGNANAIGLFFEYSGDDKYKSSGNTLGASRIETNKSTSSRYYSISFGLFVDLDGNDSYALDKPSERSEEPSNKITWFHNRKNSSPHEKGIGMDLEGGSAEMVR